MKKFYNPVLGFKIENDLGNYGKFKNSGVRFAICMREVMTDYSEAYEKMGGQVFQLAFLCENLVDDSFKRSIEMGATAIHESQDMPWNQRTALFADLDGNIHEILAEIK